MRLPMLLLGLCCLATAPASGADAPVRTDVFTSGTEGYHTFRIPSLLVTKQGTLLAFCEGRKSSKSDHGDIDLVLKRSTDGGRTWGPVQLVYEEGGDAKITIGNPCPVLARTTGTIWLPFTRDNTDVFVTHSTDEGKTWAKPTKITETVKKPEWTWYATGPGVGIQLRSGRLVIPCDHKAKSDGKATTYSHIIYSDDHGQTWQLGGTVGPHTNECQAAELPDGTLLINMRNYWGSEGKEPAKGKQRTVARSKDGGLSWSELRFDPTLIESICQASLIAYPGANAQGKSRLIFSNPASTERRHRMTVRVSTDEGQTWPFSKLIDEGPAAYSCLADLPDGTIGCLYERGDKDAYEKIVLTRFTLAWLTDGQDRPAVPPLVIGHRGLAGHAPENTLTNFRCCLELKIGLEMDVRRSKDGQLVILHDETLDRTTDGKGKVGALTLAELKKLDAGSWFAPAFKDERLPALEELFALVAKSGPGPSMVAVDLKEADTEADIVKLAQKHGIVDRLVFIGRAITMPEERRERIRQTDPKAHVASLVKADESLEAVLKDSSADWVYVRHLPGAQEVARVHAAGKKFFMSGPKVAALDPAIWKQAADLGIDAILTDDPLELAQLVRPRSR